MSEERLLQEYREMFTGATLILWVDEKVNPWWEPVGEPFPPENGEQIDE